MASGLQLRDVGAKYNVALADMARWLKDIEGSPTAGTMLPAQHLQADAISPAEQALVDSWITAQEDDTVADVSMQPHNVSWQQAASVAGQEHLHPVPSKEVTLGSWLPAQEESLAAEQPPLDGRDEWDCLCAMLCKDPNPPVPQPQSGGGPRVQSSAPSSMLPRTQPGPALLGHPRTTGSSVAMADGRLSAGSWLDSTPMQPHLHVPPRLSMLRTPHVPFQQSEHSQAALAGQSPDSAKSERMAWHILNRQAMGQREPTAADAASSGLHCLQTRLSDASTASHARPQHMQHAQHAAYGAVTAARQPRVYGLSAAERPDMVPYAVLLPTGTGQKRKAAEQQVLQGRLDDLDDVDREGTLADLPNAVAFEDSWGGSAGSSGGVAHAGEVQLGNMAAQMPAFEQQLLPAAAAAAAPPVAGTGQKRKAAEEQVSEDQADRMDSALLEALIRDMPTALAAARGNWGGSSGSAAHAGGQHLRLGNMAPFQAFAQQELPPAAATAAAEPMQPRKKRKTGFSAAWAVHRGPAPAATHAAAPTQGSGYQVGQVVWGRSGDWPWWPATVQEPDARQRSATKMGVDTDTDKVFLLYFKTLEFEALPSKKVMRWGAHKASLDDLDDYTHMRDAVHLAKQAIRGHAQ